MKFLDDTGNLHDKVYFDGHVLENRVLEGVYIEVTVADDGKASCSFRNKDKSYVKTLNAWLQEAQDFVEDAISDNDFDLFCVAPDSESGDDTAGQIVSVQKDNGVAPKSQKNSSKNPIAVPVMRASDLFKPR